MADVTYDVLSGQKKKLKDMGDGTYADVVVVEGATINASDIEIGAVELKDASTDNRAAIDASGNVSVKSAQLPSELGQKTKANSVSVVLASDGPGATSLETMAKEVAGNYEAVAASQTDQVIGSTGAAGDFLSHIMIVPTTTSPGAVSIKDGAGSSITVFTGGVLSVTDLRPFVVTLKINAATAWKVTTGANVSVIAVGKFT